MTTQYNIAIKVLKPEVESRIQTSLQGYSIFTDRSGNLQDTCFSRENVPYAGELIVVKTLKKLLAEKAHDVLSRIEGLLVLPVTECDWREDVKSIESARKR